MEQTNKVPRGLILAVCILFSLIHRLLIADRLGPTTFWRPVTSTELSSVPPVFPLNAEGCFFNNGEYVGYLSSAGKVEWYERFSGYISGTEKEVIISDSANRKIKQLQTGGVIDYEWPSPVFVSGNWKISPMESYLGLQILDDKGTMLWSRTRSSPLTCFSQSADLLAAGDASGLVEIYDRQGKVVSSFRPGGSRYEVIYQVALSPSGRRVLVLSGLEPKRLVILEKGLEDYKPIQHERVEDNRRFSTELRWLDEEHYLFSDRDGQRFQVRRVLSEWSIVKEAMGDVAHAELLGDVPEILLALYHQGRLTWHIFTQQGLSRVLIPSPTQLPWAARFGDRFFFIRDGALKVFERSLR